MKLQSDFFMKDLINMHYQIPYVNTIKNQTSGFLLACAAYIYE